MSGSREPTSESRVMGLLFVDKPAGITSHDVVAVVRRAARTRRVGHAGTLDPFATGLLVVAVGHATRLLPYIDSEPKVYDAVIRFGVEMNTDDVTGTVIREAPVPEFSALQHAIDALTGDIQQVPPSFSAKHVDGQRAYVSARKGHDVALAPVPIRVHRWDVREITADSVAVRITCAGGTYIRALARDVGRILHSAAHCASLRRVASGLAHVDDAVSMSQLLPGCVADGTIRLHSPLTLLAHLPHEDLDDAAMKSLSHGRAIAATQRGDRAVLLRAGAVVGIGERIEHQGATQWQPRVVLLDTAALAAGATP